MVPPHGGPRWAGVSMSEQGPPLSATLTDEQRRLVRDNLGLVAVHLRRNVFNLSRPRRKREWEDLFQEGCLGLIRAAAAFRAERGIPFAAFALPRIHNAVSRALLTRFSTIYVPPRRSSPKDDSSIRFASPTSKEMGHPSNPDSIVDSPSIGLRRDEESDRAPKVMEMSAELADRAAHCQRSDAASEHHPTVGDCLREKYERAVREAARTVSNRASRRGDRQPLVRALVEERFLVPEEESRRPLRRIARETRSSYGRVVDCDRQLNDEVRRTLAADPEFRALQRLSRTDPVGMKRSIDEDLERELAGIAAVEFTRRFAAAQSAERARMLQNLLEAAPGDIGEVIQSRVAALPADARERLFRGN